MHAATSPSLLTDTDHRMELAARVASVARIDSVQATAIPGVAVIRASAPSLPLPSLYDPSLCIVVQGRKTATLGRETYVYDPFHYLVVSVTLPVMGKIIEASPAAPYLCLRISMSASTIADLLLQLGPTAQPKNESDRGLYVARMNEELLDAVIRLVRLLDRPADIGVLAPLVLREIHYRALTAELGARLRALCVADSALQRIARAIHILRTRYTESLRIDDLAAAVHMSASSFHHRFKEVTTMTPVQFQKHLRLHEARRLMLSEGLEASSAAHRVGYESPSQFSREYRRLFGAPPRSEIEALRA
jgi:AraC-like DNA-binding protein